MNFNSTPSPALFATLRRLAQPRPQTEQCEFCSVGLEGGHRHLLETAARKIVCACDPCALRFENAVSRWKLIPRDTRRLADFHFTDQQWESLSLPINLAFFFHSTPGNKMTVLYPSPAGATESLLPLTAWESLVADNPALARMEPDVEALLVNRVGPERKYYLAPIDKCYELVGVIRLHWRGFSGGESVWEQLEAFFVRLDEQSEPLTLASPETSHA
ncbi:MAG TPA: DUF5947 family protein [Verrucomicrobiae bacterium]|nr:DUF5947 family protein [Verrucomicrobiae bacterium]